jgi:hypothetical protein
VRAVGLGLGGAGTVDTGGGIVAVDGPDGASCMWPTEGFIGWKHPLRAIPRPQTSSFLTMLPPTPPCTLTPKPLRTRRASITKHSKKLFYWRKAVVA